MDSQLNNKDNTNGKKKLSPLAKLLGITEETIKDTKTNASSDISDDDEKIAYNQNVQNSKIESNFICKSFCNQNSNNNSNLNFQNYYDLLMQNYNIDYRNNQLNIKKFCYPIYCYYNETEQKLFKEIKSFVDKNNKNFIEKKTYYNDKNNKYFLIHKQKNNSLNEFNEINNNHIINIKNQINNNIENTKIKKTKPFIGRTGDWVCGNCRNLNFAFRVMCNRCNLSKSESQKMIFGQIENQNTILSNLINQQNSFKIKK